VATCNVGSLKKYVTEVDKSMSTTKVGLCGVQEHRWAGGLTSNDTCLMKGSDSCCKLYWCGNKEGQCGAGILLAEHWLDKVFEVVRISDSKILLRLVIGKVVFTFLFMYTPQYGFLEAVKQLFYDQLEITVSKLPASEIPILVAIGMVRLLLMPLLIKNCMAIMALGLIIQKRTDCRNMLLPTTSSSVTTC